MKRRRADRDPAVQAELFETLAEVDQKLGSLECADSLLSTALERRRGLGRTMLRERRFAEAEVESLTGYQILSQQASPRVNWLQNARQDLVSIYAALHEPEKAQKFRVEQSALVRN